MTRADDDGAGAAGTEEGLMTRATTGVGLTGTEDGGDPRRRRRCRLGRH